MARNSVEDNDNAKVLTGLADVAVRIHRHFQPQTDEQDNAVDTYVPSEWVSLTDLLVALGVSFKTDAPNPTAPLTLISSTDFVTETESSDIAVVIQYL